MMLNFTTLAFALATILALAPVGRAVAQSGYQVINGTRVFTQIDQATGVATFSNDCGSQTLTQRQLQAGAIPSQIIPCPRSQSGGGTPGKRYAQKAADSFSSANNLFRNGSFNRAAEGFALAEGYYREVGDVQNAAAARRNKNLSTCKDRLNYLIVNDPKSLPILLGEGKELRNPVVIDGITTFEPMLGACSDFPAEANTIRRKLAELGSGTGGSASAFGTANAVNRGRAQNPEEARRCISSSRSDMNLGYIDWKVTNSCDFPVTFDYDDCGMNPDLQPVCTVKSQTVSGNSYTVGSNYHLPANARNWR